ncbi:anti-sigma factor family protein [Streptomyces tirandamycinicus]|uniref:anti-sigma factor family protein n=1 Tax=Streptomyces tirandamycinicus TaxID=2174846 RepID=UPI002270E843|nr:zf-HC2 domain-containing protein [Streptomyces tirandamycinicus]MCY0979782.1 zf-HC2 domain-containing protein [Streptomyces tirandamycinicus]
MNLREQHRAVAAYALGVLDPADAFRFEEHLSECGLCALRLSDFAPVASALGALAGPGRPDEPPAPRLLERLLHEVAARRRRGSRRRLRLVAVAAALVVTLPAMAVSLLPGKAGPAESGPDERIAATDGATGVYGAVDLRSKGWGTAVALRMAKLPGPRTCRLVAVDRDGREYPVTSWSVPPGGYGTGTPGTQDELDMEVGTALQRDEIGHFEVRTESGEHLVSLDRRASAPDGSALRPRTVT